MTVCTAAVQQYNEHRNECQSMNLPQYFWQIDTHLLLLLLLMEKKLCRLCVLEICTNCARDHRCIPKIERLHAQCAYSNIPHNSHNQLFWLICLHSWFFFLKMLYFWVCCYCAVWLTQVEIGIILKFTVFNVLRKFDFLFVQIFKTQY